MEKRLLFYIFIFLFSIVSKAQNFDWAYSINSTYIAYSGDLTLDSNKNIYTTGLFRGVADFDPGPGFFYLSSSGTYGDYLFQKQIKMPI